MTNEVVSARYNEIYKLISPSAINIDKSRMLVNIATFPEALLHGASAYSRISKALKNVPRNPRGVAVSGMGGSFIGGLFIQDVLYDTSRIPIYLIRDSRLPLFLDDNYLLIVVSYSGNTEETLRVFHEALQRKIPLISVTSGGLLQKYSEKYSVPVISLPQGFQPRAAFPYMACALLSIIETVAGEASLLKQIAECSESLRLNKESILRKAIEDSGTFHAFVEKGLTPLIYSYRPYISAGYRFKTQLNENAKIHAFYLDLPEANHNEIMGWRPPAFDKFFAVIIRGAEEPHYLSKRIEFLKNYFESNNIAFISYLPDVRQEGKRTCELLSLIYKLDIISVGAALRLKTDPTPVDTITRLKKYIEKFIDVERELFPRENS
jgi:glucose/mannose-6-phosphate isomerase